MEDNYEFVDVDEFDALAIELKSAIELKPAAEVKPPPPSGAAADDLDARAPSPLMSEVSGKYPAKEHARKVVKELGAENGLIYLPGQVSQLHEDSDMAPEFRQRRYFYYLAGADFADCAVTYEIVPDRLILWIPYTDPRKVLWYGSTPGIPECKERLDVDDVRYTSGLSAYLEHYISLRTLSALFVLNAGQTPEFDGPPSRGTVHFDTTRLRPAMDAARVVKTDYEVAMIRQANAVSSAAHRAVMERIRRLTNEREIEAIFKGACIARGAKHQAYPVIAGSGANAATLHYEDNDQPLAGRQVVVVDAGCEWNCYASDVTRTLLLGGNAPTPEATAVYALVERMQEETICRVRPGVRFRSLHLHACAVAAEGLLRLGILRSGTAEEILARGTVAAFFPHGLGHHVGLEVHDVSGAERLMKLGTNPTFYGGRQESRGNGLVGKRQWVSPEMMGAMRRDAATVTAESDKGGQRLAKNMIVTIEPGIYFCREYIEAYFLTNPGHAKYIDKAVLEKYYPVGGVRIEDDILVTEDGYDNLTTAPKGKEAVKIMNGS